MAESKKFREPDGFIHEGLYGPYYELDIDHELGINHLKGCTPVWFTKEAQVETD